jgi:hypothetical protein
VSVLFSGIYLACWRYMLRVGARVSGRPEIIYSVRFDDAEVVLEITPCDDVCRTERISWNEVRFVYAYKQDCYAVDQIRLEVLDDRGKGLMVTEELRGWDGLVRALPEKLPGCRKFEDWFSVVAFPAFQQNMTLLYERTHSEILASK